MVTIIRWLVVGTSVVYSVVLLILALLWSHADSQPWWLALSDIFAPYLFIPLVLLIPLALIVRSSWLRLSVVAATLVFIVAVGAYLLPLAPEQPNAETTLRVVTFNHLYANRDVDGIITAIRLQDADVVALQELSTAVTQAAQEQLINEYPYQLMSPAERDLGLGLLSRYPFQVVPLERGFLGQHVVVDVNGQLITVINAHLSAPSIHTTNFEQIPEIPIIRDYNTSQRSAELPGLLGMIDQVEGPLIVAGDLNMSDREQGYTQLAERLQDTYRSTNYGFGFTFPDDIEVRGITIPIPLVRIDYIWSSYDITPLNTWVECNNGGSDHCMVIADVRVNV